MGDGVVDVPQLFLFVVVIVAHGGQYVAMTNKALNGFRVFAVFEVAMDEAMAKLMMAYSMNSTMGNHRLMGGYGSRAKETRYEHNWNNEGNM